MEIGEHDSLHVSSLTVDVHAKNVSTSETHTSNSNLQDC